MVAKPGPEIKESTRFGVTVSKQFTRAKDAHTFRSQINFTMRMVPTIWHVTFFHGLHIAVDFVNINEVIIVYVVLVRTEFSLTPESLTIGKRF